MQTYLVLGLLALAAFAALPAAADDAPPTPVKSPVQVRVHAAGCITISPESMPPVFLDIDSCLPGGHA